MRLHTVPNEVSDGIIRAACIHDDDFVLRHDFILDRVHESINCRTLILADRVNAKFHFTSPLDSISEAH
jgi:hypothetical protein